ncbi:MAG: 16S rRNA (adenine(1518)-N(6)/adenine(1519)-N(6))-dimethyltransferase RsmA [Bacteroidales bacterium]
MNPVRAKKHLGQHFLTDENIAGKIVNSLGPADRVLEIGPGTGVLTKYLINKADELKLIEIDSESVAWLRTAFPGLSQNIIEADFLKLDLTQIFKDEFSLIGNFPYNISSQIFFRILEHRHLIPEAVGMIQKEVAERLTASPGNKVYGILTVLLGAFYVTEYLFTVNEKVFSPPPKVKSAVIRLQRKADFSLDCDEKLFFRIVKSAFNQRRKTLRNSLRQYTGENPDIAKNDIFNQRPEQLSTAEFVKLTRLISGDR